LRLRQITDGKYLRIFNTISVGDAMLHETGTASCENNLYSDNLGNTAGNMCRPNDNVRGMPRFMDSSHSRLGSSRRRVRVPHKGCPFARCKWDRSTIWRWLRHRCL
jgi:hypothetical protein